MDPDTAILLDPKSGGEAALRAAARLGAVPARLWSDIANDPSYGIFHRNLATYELIRRHLPRPSTLKETAALLAGGRWLADARVERISLMGGEIPIGVPVGGAAFIVRLARDSAAAARSDIGFYLALDRDLEPELLRNALMSRSDDARASEARIVDFALFPPALGETIAMTRGGSES